MALKIREAEEQDTEGIVECHCSDVEKWHGFRDSKVVEIRYEELTAYERCHFNCGEWLDRDVCEFHLGLLKEKNEKAFVAEFEGKVVGEAEVCLAKEPLPYGKYAFLTTLMVHRTSRRRGIGLELVRHTIQWAREKGYQAYDTIPENDASERLYRKAGLELMQSLYELRGDVESLKMAPVRASTEELSMGDDPSDDLLMVAGHVEPSIHVWKDGFNNTLLLRFNGYEGRISQPLAVRLSGKHASGIVLLVPAIYDPSKSLLYLYTEPQMLGETAPINALIHKGLELAQENNIQILQTSVDEEMLPIFRNVGFHQTGHEALYMRLTNR